MSVLSKSIYKNARSNAFCLELSIDVTSDVLKSYILVVTHSRIMIFIY